MAGPQHDERLRLLRDVPLFSHLERRHLDSLAETATIATAAVHQVLFRKGDRGRHFYGIVRGRVKVTTASAEGGEVVFDIIGEGETFGELALLAGGRRTATVETLEPCEFIVIDRRDFLDLLRRDAELSVALLAQLAERLAEVSATIEDTAFLSLQARLAKKLLELAEEFGESIEDGVRVPLVLSQSELAAMVRASRESANKQLQSLRRAGILSMERGTLTVHRLEALRSLVAATSS